MESVEVFKTTVGTRAAGRRLAARLQRLFPTCRVTFDLDDCDKILRMAGPAVSPSQVIACLAAAGYDCSLLE